MKSRPGQGLTVIGKRIRLKQNDHASRRTQCSPHTRRAQHPIHARREQHPVKQEFRYEPAARKADGSIDDCADVHSGRVARGARLVMVQPSLRCPRIRSVRDVDHRERRRRRPELADVAICRSVRRGRLGSRVVLRSDPPLNAQNTPFLIYIQTLIVRVNSALLLFAIACGSASTAFLKRSSRANRSTR
jgi:hypothetical protein